MKKYVAYYNRTTRKLEKKLQRIHSIDVISLALYLPLVISLDAYAFDCRNIKCRIGGSYLQERSLPLLFLETL